MTSTTLTIDQIEISPLNVRTYRPDAEDTEALEASILVEGLHYPIVVHPMRGRKGKWGAVAGGRRTRAVRALVTRGALPKDWPVKVEIREGLGDAELIEISITENLLRRDLRDHELYAAIARAKAKGHDPETIARQIGQTDVAKVRKWARLGELAPPVFGAFAAGMLHEEVAKAYAATADVALQAAVFERLSTSGYHTAHAVRQALKVGDREEARLLTFVGEAVYRAAGGSYELDLFADVEPDRGRVTDAALLRRLVEEKLAGVRDEVRRACAAPQLRFVPEPPAAEWGGADHQLAVTPRRRADGTLILPDAAVVAHVEIDAGGDPVVTYWWESRAAKFGTGEGKAARSAGELAATPRVVALRDGDATADDNRISARVEADAAIKEDAGLAQDPIQIARSLRKQILRGLLIDDARAGGDVAADYLIWAQLRMLAGRQASGNRAAQIGMRPIAEPTWVGMTGVTDRIQAALDEQPATRVIAEAIREVTAQSFFTDADLAAAFLDFRCSPPSIKRLAAAVVAGLALERSLAAPGYGCAPHDAVAAEIIEPTLPDDVARTIRRHWTPTEAFLAMLPKPAQLAIAARFIGEKTLGVWGKLKASELTYELGRVLTGASAAALPEKRAAAELWVHPLLRFDPRDTKPEPVHAEAADESEPCEGGAHCCCCGPGEQCCDCGEIMPDRQGDATTEFAEAAE